VLSISQGFAPAEENGLTLRVYAEAGGDFAGQQEKPELFWISTVFMASPDKTADARPGRSIRTLPSLNGARCPTGHPEGYLEAFGHDLLRRVVQCIRRPHRRAGPINPPPTPPNRRIRTFGRSTTALRGIQFKKIFLTPPSSRCKSRARVGRNVVHEFHDARAPRNKIALVTGRKQRAFGRRNCARLAAAGWERDRHYHHDGRGREQRQPSRTSAAWGGKLGEFASRRRRRPPQVCANMFAQKSVGKWTSSTALGSNTAGRAGLGTACSLSEQDWDFRTIPHESEGCFLCICRGAGRVLMMQGKPIR